MVFCNLIVLNLDGKLKEVTILILIDGFLQYDNEYGVYEPVEQVTILILIDGFLQLRI